MGQSPRTRVIIACIGGLIVFLAIFLSVCSALSSSPSPSADAGAASPLHGPEGKLVVVKITPDQQATTATPLAAIISVLAETVNTRIFMQYGLALAVLATIVVLCWLVATNFVIPLVSKLIHTITTITPPRIPVPPPPPQPIKEDPQPRPVVVLRSVDWSRIAMSGMVLLLIFSLAGYTWHRRNDPVWAGRHTARPQQIDPVGTLPSKCRELLSLAKQIPTPIVPSSPNGASKSVHRFRLTNMESNQTSDFEIPSDKPLSPAHVLLAAYKQADQLNQPTISPFFLSLGHGGSRFPLWDDQKYTSAKFQITWLNQANAGYSRLETYLDWGIAVAKQVLGRPLSDSESDLLAQGHNCLNLT